MKCHAEPEALTLPELRRHCGRSQRALAEAMTISQPQVARYERQLNPRLAALRNYVQALGGELQLIATIGGKTIPLRLQAETTEFPAGETAPATCQPPGPPGNAQ